MVMARVAAALVFVECLQAFAPPPLLRAGPRVSSSQRRAALEIAEESEDFVRVSQMFVEAFWTDKAEGLELKEEQRRRLRREQEVEFRRRDLCTSPILVATEARGCLRWHSDTTR